MNTVNILGFNISNAGLKSDTNFAYDFIASGLKSRYMACANPHSVIESKSDALFAEALHSADILLPDGAGILLAAKILNLDLSERVAGTEFFLELSKLCHLKGNVRVFFLGSSSVVLEKLRIRLNTDFPNIEVCGLYSPPFKDEFSEQENNDMVAAVNNARPNVLWVGMTAPKQEKWIYLNKDKLDVNFIGAIGAVFDFYAGTKKRAPQWICSIGLEWLPRFLREPKRLWKRNFVSSPLFLLAVSKQKILR